MLSGCFFRNAGLIAVSLFVAGNVLAQDPMPDKEGLKSAFPTRPYSPPAGRDFPMKVLWGDTHVHTAMSMDAGSFGARLGPEDAYRFARGEELTSSTGLQVKLARPLDFLVVADHSDNMGFFPRLYAGDPELLADPTGRRWYDMIQAGGQKGVEVAVEIIVAFSQGTFPPALCVRPGTPPTARPGTRPSRPRRSTTTRASSPLSSAGNGRRTQAATTCTGS